MRIKRVAAKGLPCRNSDDPELATADADLKLRYVDKKLDRAGALLPGAKKQLGPQIESLIRSLNGAVAPAATRLGPGMSRAD